jgi:hypothetical protein
MKEKFVTFCFCPPDCRKGGISDGNAGMKKYN